jgi:hypothetical protein
MWNHASVHLEMTLVSVQDRCTVALNVPWAQKSFWTHPMALLGDEAQVELVSVRLEIALILRHDKCMVCTKRAIGSKIILNAPDGTPIS